MLPTLLLGTRGRREIRDVSFMTHFGLGGIYLHYRNASIPGFAALRRICTTLCLTSVTMSRSDMPSACSHRRTPLNRHARQSSRDHRGVFVASMRGLGSAHGLLLQQHQLPCEEARCGVQSVHVGACREAVCLEIHLVVPGGEGAIQQDFDLTSQHVEDG